MTLLKTIAALLALCAPPALAQTADPEVEAVLAEARAECALYDAGVVTYDDAAVSRIDVTGDGAPELFVDERYLTCSSIAAFRSGTGGWFLHVVAGGKPVTWQVLGWSVIDWQPDPEYPAEKVLLLARHGSNCGLAGSSSCVEALIWSEFDGAFASTSPKE